MKKEFREKFPSWVFEKGDFTTCLTDDIDSLVGVTLLKEVKGWEIGHFYDFHNIYSIDKKDKRKAVGVDMAILEGRTFDNHVVKLSANSQANPLSANPNVIENISRDNYTKKYALSTALLIWSLYDIPLPSTDEGKMLLMGIDSSFKGYYSGFKKVQTQWLEKLGFEELIELQERYDIMDFVHVKRKYNSSEKIVLVDGKLHTNMKLEDISRLLEFNIQLPKETFVLRKSFKRDFKELHPDKSYSNGLIELKYNPFSMALTGKHKLNLTII